MGIETSFAGIVVVVWLCAFALAFEKNYQSVTFNWIVIFLSNYHHYYLRHLQKNCLFEYFYLRVQSIRISFSLCNGKPQWKKGHRPPWRFLCMMIIDHDHDGIVLILLLFKLSRVSIKDHDTFLCVSYFLEKTLITKLCRWNSQEAEQKAEMNCVRLCVHYAHFAYSIHTCVKGSSKIAYYCILNKKKLSLCE